LEREAGCEREWCLIQAARLDRKADELESQQEQGEEGADSSSAKTQPERKEGS